MAIDFYLFRLRQTHGESVSRNLLIINTIIVVRQSRFLEKYLDMSEIVPNFAAKLSAFNGELKLQV